MFKKTIESFGEFTLIRITNTETGEYFSVLPECGGKVQELVLRKGENLHSVLESKGDPTSVNGDQWHKGDFLIPFPNRIRDGRYEFEGKEYLLPINMPSEGHAIHGFVYDKVFAVTAKDSEESGALELSYAYDGSIEGYPFPFTVTYTFSLSAEGFTCNVHCVNNGNKKMPLGAGWHPYFSIGDSVDTIELRLPNVVDIEVDERMIPTAGKSLMDDFSEPREIEDISFDTGFEIIEEGEVAVTTIRSKEKDLTLQLWQNTGDRGFNYVQIFTPPGRKSIAIEPMTCPADAFNSKESLILLDPKEEWSGSFGVRLR